MSTNRPAVVAGGLLARTRMLPAWSVWPHAGAPGLALDPGRPAAAAWLRRTLLRGQRSEGIAPAAVWQAVRSRALVLGTGPSLAVEGAERGLGRRLDDPMAAIASPGGCANKATAFVFDGEAEEPIAVVKVMTNGRRHRWLRHEVALVRSLREILNAPTVDALPEPPLFEGLLRGDYVVVEAYDHLAAGLGLGDPAGHLGWLREFRRATSIGRAAWDERDELMLTAVAAAGWRRFRPGREHAVVDAMNRTFDRLPRSSVRRCAMHGDFFPGNVSQRDGALRVLDWEWGALSGDPFLDPWTYELAQLRGHVATTAAHAFPELAASLARVAAELEDEGGDGRYALPTMASSIGRLVTRIRDATAQPNGWEDAAVPMMRAAEELLLDAGMHTGSNRPLDLR